MAITLAAVAAVWPLLSVPAGEAHARPTCFGKPATIAGTNGPNVIRLTGGKDIREIHPLVVRYTGNNPCVPIKLTSVAAVDNMGIRTFFLGGRRVVPKNYKHVVPNLVKFDWFNASTDYANLVIKAIDSPVSNGKAWLTEYAGPTAIVGAQPIASPSI